MAPRTRDLRPSRTGTVAPGPDARRPLSWTCGPDQLGICSRHLGQAVHLQIVGPVAAVPFTASLALFGSTELIGYLPVYGVLLAFVVLGSSAVTADVVRRLLSLPAGHRRAGVRELSARHTAPTGSRSPVTT